MSRLSEPPVNPPARFVRPSQDETLMAVAATISHRSTCHRYVPESHVGAVIARDGRIIESGYNGAPAGMPHCQHPGTHIDASSTNLQDLSSIFRPLARGCTIAIHAEANAIAYAARNGTPIGGATLYTTLSPCQPCAQLIIAAGLTRVVYGHPYRDRSGLKLLDSAGVILETLK